MESGVVAESAQLPVPRLRDNVAAGQALPLGSRTLWKPVLLSCARVARVKRN